MSKEALRILLYQTDLYLVIQNRYLQKRTLMSQLFSYILQLAVNSSTFSKHWTRAVNDIMRDIIYGQVQKLANAYSWIQPW